MLHTLSRTFYVHVDSSSLLLKKQWDCYTKFIFLLTKQ